MSLIPFLLNDALDDTFGLVRRRPVSIFDQNFGLGVLSDDLIQPYLASAPLLSGYIRPWRHQLTRHSGVSNVENSRDGFKVNLDVQQFKPEEVTVKMVDNFVVVEGKHEEREDDHGYISRQFQRRYRVPDEVDPDKVISKLSSDGVLTIEAPKKVEALPSRERVVEITRTNAPAVKAQASGKEDSSEKMDQ